MNLAKIPITHVRRKHIKILCHWIREVVAKGELKLHYCAINVMTAHLSIKVFPKDMFFTCIYRSSMHVGRVYPSPVVRAL